MDALETCAKSDAPARFPSSGPRSTLFHLSFPMFLHSLLTFAVMLLEIVIVSAHSADAAAAVAVARQVLQIAFEMSAMVGIGAVILISHSLGRGDETGARRLAVLAVAANALFGLGTGIVLFVAGPFLIDLLNASDAIAGDAQRYLAIVAAAMVFNGAATAAIACLRAFGRSRNIVLLGIILSVLHVGLDYVLVLGLGSIPALGVTGAALATLLVRILMALLFVSTLIRTLGLRLEFGAIKAQVFALRQMLALAFPSVSDYIGYGFYQLFLLGFVAGFGVESVLSRTYVMLAMTFLILVVMAVSQGNEVLIGYRCGEGRRDAAHRQALSSAFAATVVTTAIATLIWLLADRFVSLFDQGPAVLQHTETLLLLTIFLQPGFAFNTILLHSLRAVGDVRWPVMTSIAITWGLGLPLAWLFCIHAGFGVEGIWYALIVEETLKAGFMLQRWLRRGWLNHAIA